jgi:hypothetical protein
MARVKGGTVAVEIALDREQFDKDFKAAGREIAAVQKQLSLELERNKVRFAIEGVDKDWIDKLFGNTAIGKIRNARREVEFLNQQIGFQRNKTDVAKASWDALTTSKGSMHAATIAAEKAFLREQMALVGLKKQIDGTTTATNIMAVTLKNTALTAAAAAAAIATAYAGLAKSATEWGAAVNDISDATGMADAESSKLAAILQIVGINAADAGPLIVKMARSVEEAGKAQQAASREGKASDDVFTRFGIAITDAGGNMLTYADIMNNIQDVHRNMQDGTKKTAMEMEIFGRSGAKMNDFLNLSKAQMEAYTKEAEKMGVVITDSQKYEDLNRELSKLSLSLKGIAVTITGDDIPAIQLLIANLSEFAGWIKENKAAIDDLKSSVETIGGWISKPFTAGMELAITGAKKFVEAVNEAAKAEQAATIVSGSTLDDVAAAAKIAEKNLQKQSDAAKSKAAAEKDLIFAQRELQDAVLTLQGKTLAVTLANIDREREAWVKKTKDEVAATQWAEAAKTKAFQDALDARLGPEVAAAKKALLEGTDVNKAIAEASTKRKDEERATYDARQLVKKFYGIAEPGDEIKKLQVDYMKNTITQITEIAKSLVIPKDFAGMTVFDQYKPRKQQVYTDEQGNRTNGIPQGQPGSIFITVPVAIDGQQVGEGAAKVILPAVQANPTSYGG